MRTQYLTAVVICFLLVESASAADSQRLSRELEPILAPFARPVAEFVIEADVRFSAGSEQHTVEIELARLGPESFQLKVHHADYAAEIARDAHQTVFALPKHRTAFVGQGSLEGSDTLAPEGIIGRLVGPDTILSAYCKMLQGREAATIGWFVAKLLKVEHDPDQDAWTNHDNLKLQFTSPNELTARIGDIEVRLNVDSAPEEFPAAISYDGYQVVALDRTELERQLSRGARRTLEVFAPGPNLISPARKPREVAHGKLRWIEGQRVAVLHGSPEEVGAAHGELLKPEATRCFDSVLYAFGTVETVRSGRWFRHRLDEAYERLAPHIPEDHKRETRALAVALGVEPRLAEALNVFPELFHCSGFAVAGSATRDGKLYHGRVLDYMTTIGLQDAATTFIVAVDGKHSFANIGYAGFIGSVTGMNSQSISLGEMGGRGEGQWDGVPMATLMRRALEECSSLEQVMELWEKNPRTCEYYYVFADGKSRSAVGVAATPNSLEFVHPGQAHELLGEGIPDAVVLSAGSRLETLRSRVRERHGEIDADTALWLMSRPVAMESNLHNVLFVPEDGLFYVANASHNRPAAERPYVRYDLNALLKQLP